MLSLAGVRRIGRDDFSVSHSSGSTKGLPAVVVLIWSITKVYFSKYDFDQSECPWQAQDEYDYIYKVPILVVLIVSWMWNR